MLLSLDVVLASSRVTVTETVLAWLETTLGCVARLAPVEVQGF